MNPANKSLPPTPLLALDTATESCSVALTLSHGQCLSRDTDIPRQHSQVLFTLIDQLLEEARIKKSELACLACGIGPGTFTGVRIAVAVAQGLAAALNLPIVPVSNLLAVAQNGYEQLAAQGIAPPPGFRLRAVIDARMHEIYSAVFHWDGSALQRTGKEQLLSAKQLLQEETQHPSNCLAGNALTVFDELSTLTSAFMVPAARSHARIIAKLAAGQPRLVEPTSLQPAYLRQQVTHQKT